LPQSFLPELHEGHYLVHMETAPGTSIDESLRIGSAVTHELLTLPFVRTVAQRVGRAATDDVYGTHTSELELDLKPVSGDVAATAAEKLREVLSGIPGTAFSVNTFLTERIEETISGYTAPVVINIYGNDLGIIDIAAKEIAAVVSHVRAPQTCRCSRRRARHNWRSAFVTTRSRDGVSRRAMCSTRFIPLTKEVWPGRSTKERDRTKWP
jgi:Cu/Ag efflux pump CusA